MSKCTDVMLVVGTSALMQPPASFPLGVKEQGGKLVEIDVEDTPLTQMTFIHLNGKTGEMLTELDSVLSTDLPEN